MKNEIEIDGKMVYKGWWKAKSLPAEIAPEGNVIVDGRISIGKDTKIWGYTKIIGDVKVGSNCMVASYCLLKGLAGPVIIGNYTRIQDYCFIDGPSEIGESCFFGARVQIGNDRFPMSSKNRGATIGNNVIVGNCVNIVPDITIGDNSVIAASTLVTKDIPSNSFVMGFPGKVVGTRQDYENKKKEWLNDKKY